MKIKSIEAYGLRGKRHRAVGYSGQSHRTAYRAAIGGKIQRKSEALRGPLDGRGHENTVR